MSLREFWNRRISRRSGLRIAGGSLLVTLVAGMPWRPVAAAGADDKTQATVLTGEDLKAAVAAAGADRRVALLTEFIGQGMQPREVKAARVVKDVKASRREYEAVVLVWDQGHVSYVRGLHAGSAAGAFLGDKPYEVKDGAVVPQEAVTTSAGFCEDCSSHFDCTQYDHWCDNTCCGFDSNCMLICGGLCATWANAFRLNPPYYWALLLAFCASCFWVCCNDSGYHCVTMPAS